MTDFSTITACGECCAGCAKKLDGRCPGCIESDGRVPEWAESGRCRIHACVKEHHVRFCGLCAEFPCGKLPSLISWNPDAVEQLTALRDEYRKQNMVKVRFYDQAEDWKLRFAVIITKTNGHWVFCKHKDRDTLEIPGGHREPGEEILTTAKRELHEETGAVDFSIRPVCVYSVTAPWNFNGQETFGMLFFADVKAFDENLQYEIERIVIQDGLPAAWTYPEIQPYLLQEVQKRLMNDRASYE